jgi:hypothetical protein
MRREAVHTWVKLMLMYRMNKVFSDQNIKEPKFRETMLYYEHFREKAVFNNVSNVKEYFINHPQELTELVKVVDNAIPEQTVWRYLPTKGSYVFEGAYEQTVYHLNLFTGIILKNGVELAGLPDLVKKNKDFVTIFGVNRDL